MASNKRRRHTPDQIIRKLAEGNKLLGGGPGARRGVPAPADRGVDLASLGRPVRRHESERRQAAQRARGRERPAQEAGGEPGPRHRHAQGDPKGELLTPNRRRRAVVMLPSGSGSPNAGPARWLVSTAPPSAWTHPATAEDD